LQDKTERWMELCRQAAIEQDPDKLLALVKEINDLLEAKERRLGILPNSQAKTKEFKVAHYRRSSFGARTAPERCESFEFWGTERWSGGF
jgi:hypothetical protein